MDNTKTEKQIKIPIYEEIPIGEFHYTSLIKILKEKRVNQVPCYILLPQLPTKEIYQILDELHLALKELSLNPYFPYPLYIVTQEIKSHPIFRISPSVEELPVHFFKQVRRPKSKESQLLSKNSLLAEKIQNDEIERKLKMLKSQKKQQKRLFQKTILLSFILKQLKKLQGQEQVKND